VILNRGLFHGFFCLKWETQVTYFSATFKLKICKSTIFKGGIKLTNTENYNLNLPDADDFYNIEDINENMETIDAAMFSLEENIGQTAEKIGSSADTGTETVMAKLNSVISALGTGMTAVKKVQFGKINAGTSSTGNHNTFKVSTASSATYSHYIDVTISQVADINKCDDYKRKSADYNGSRSSFGYL
jgi:hypothetical protein